MCTHRLWNIDKILTNIDTYWQILTPILNLFLSFVIHFYSLLFSIDALNIATHWHSTIHLIGTTPAYHGQCDSNSSLPPSSCTKLLDTLETLNVTCDLLATTSTTTSSSQNTLRLRMPVGNNFSGLLLGDVQFTMVLRKKGKKKKKGKRLGDKTGFWLHTAMMPLDGSAIQLYKQGRSPL